MNIVMMSKVLGDLGEIWGILGMLWRFRDNGDLEGKLNIFTGCDVLSHEELYKKGVIALFMDR